MEKYYAQSSYNYCGNNPVVFVDPNGMDYWTTSDPGMIALFLNTLRGTNSNPVESFDYSGWAHYTDAEVTSLLTLNDKTKKLWSSYGAVIDDVGSCVGVSLDVEMLLGMAAFVSSRQSVLDRIARNDWYRRSSGAIRQDNTLVALLLPIGKGIGLVTSGAGKLVGMAAKTGTNAFKHSYKYADRVRVRGVQDPVSHNFPYNFDDAILSTNPILKNNGYKIFQQSGTMNGKNGVFEIVLTKDGIIDHRFFRPIK